MSTLPSLIKDVQLLSLGDKKKLMAVLKELIPAELCTIDALKVEVSEELFYDQLAAFLRNKLRINLAPIRMILNGKQGTDFKLCVKYLDDFYGKVAGKSVNRRAMKAKFFLLYLQLTAKSLEHIKAPANIKTLINGYERFPSLIDREFPNYIESGLFHMVLEGY